MDRQANKPNYIAFEPPRPPKRRRVREAIRRLSRLIPTRACCALPRGHEGPCDRGCMYCRPGQDCFECGRRRQFPDS